MRVDEGERRVARERDALSRRPNRDWRRRGRNAIEFARQCENTVAIDMRLDEIGDRLEARVERLRLARLNEAKMALGQRDMFVARHRAHDRNADRFDGLRDQPPVALAADAIDNDACDFEPLVISSAALDDRRRRLRLAANVDDEQDWHGERRRHIGRGAGAPACRRHAVEQPHRRFAQSKRASSCRLRGNRRQKLGRQGPGIEVDAFPPRGCGMEGRVDVIGARFEADDVHAAAPERPQKAKRRRRLAAAGARRGDHEPPGHGRPSRQTR